MAYRIVKGAGVWWPVQVPVPVDGGGIAVQTFELKFRRMGIDQAQAITAVGVDFVKVIALDVRGAETEDGAIAFTDAGIATLLDGDFPIGKAINDAWIAFLNGQPEIRAGNSAPSAAPGPAADAAIPEAPTSSAP